MLSDEESQSQEPFQKATAQQNDIHWSHSLQALLIRTPSPGGTKPDETREDHCQALDYGQNQRNGEIESRPAKRQRCNSSMTSSVSEESDPRRLLMKRRHICAEGGRLKRVASKKLPFETIPQDDLTVNLSVKARVRMSQLRDATLEFMSSDRATEKDPVIQFNNMEEIDKIDGLLRRVTESWLERDSSIEVEYILRSGAKGKSKA